MCYVTLSVLLPAIRNAFTGGVSTFNCVVYFVRKADSQEIRWGTETPIQVRNKVWGIRTDTKVRSAYKVRIENPVTFKITVMPFSA